MRNGVKDNFTMIILGVAAGLVLYHFSVLIRGLMTSVSNGAAGTLQSLLR